MAFEYPTSVGLARLTKNRPVWTFSFVGKKRGRWRSPDEAAQAVARHKTELPNGINAGNRCAGPNRAWRPLGESICNGENEAATRCPARTPRRSRQRRARAPRSRRYACVRTCRRRAQNNSAPTAEASRAVEVTSAADRGRAGQGRKDRNAMLSPQLLELLRLWWHEGKRRVLCCLRAGCFRPELSRTHFDSPNHRAVHEAAEAAFKAPLLLLLSSR